MSERFLCAKYENKKISVSIYLSSCGKIELSEIYTSSLNDSVLSHIMILYEPTLAILSSSSSEDFKQVFSKLNTVYIPKIDYSYDACKELIISYCYNGDELLAITSIDFEQRDLISCCGALLKFLKGTELKVYSIIYDNPYYLSVDFSTINSLQIIKEDIHPSSIKSSGKSKEGLSILSLIDHTFTPQGKRKLKELVLKPFCRLDSIKTRLELIDYFILNSSLIFDISAQLKHTSDLETILKKFKDACELSSDWLKLLQSLKSFICISRRLQHLSSAPLLLNSLSSIPLTRIENLCNLLDSCLIFSPEGPHVQKDVSPDLDRLSQTHQELEKFLISLSDIERKELKSVPFSRLSIFFMQGLGYVIELYFSSSEFPQDIDLEGISFQFATDDCLYFRSVRTLELDKMFGDLQGEIKSAEKAILLRIQSEILQVEEEIILISRLLGDVDCIISLAIFAESYKLTRPELFEDPRLQIVNGRHLLVEMCVVNYIPNDCALDNTHRIAVITGPNYSGKSVYLKAMGIIVYLAHIGSYVPAEIAEIGIMTHIFSRIHSSDNRSCSSFSEEIKQIAIALNNSSESSLILIDEFGKGTCNLDGISLFAGLIEELSGNIKTLAMLTTHYQELFEYNLVRESEIVRFYTMETAGGEKPAFLYKLILGLSSGSHGIHCARWAGVPEDVIQAAVALKSALQPRLAYLSGLYRAICQFTASDDPSSLLSALLSFRKTE